MITPESINLAALPSITLSDHAALPSVPAVYFCLSSSDEILYIGQAANLARRWKQHHRQMKLEKIGQVKLAWLQVSDASLLLTIYNLAICRLIVKPFNR